MPRVPGCRPRILLTVRRGREIFPFLSPDLFPTAGRGLFFPPVPACNRGAPLVVPEMRPAGNSQYFRKNT